MTGPDLAGAHCHQPGVDPTWFDSDAPPAGRLQAHRTCTGCPVTQTCLEQAVANKDSGWYADQLLRRGVTIDARIPTPRQVATRDATDLDLRAAWARYAQGVRDTHTVDLAREYDRRRKHRTREGHSA